MAPIHGMVRKIISETGGYAGPTRNSSAAVVAQKSSSTQLSRRSRLSRHTHIPISR